MKVRGWKGEEKWGEDVAALFMFTIWRCLSFLTWSVSPSCSGDIDSAVELLESVYTQNNEHIQNPSISFVFRKVLDANNEAALDKRKTQYPPPHISL